jgi:hypothetical protein
MALKSWLASLKADVSSVSGVQAPIHAGLGRYVTETTGVSGVSGSGGMVASDMADTAGNKQAYQAKPSWVLACTGDTADTYKKNNTEAHPANKVLSVELVSTEFTGPQWLCGQSGLWLSDGEQSAARAYHAHHFNCHICIAAGRGNRYGRRCAVGFALWDTYSRCGSPSPVVPTSGSIDGVED